MTIVDTAPSGVALDIRKIDWDRYATQFGFKHDWLGKTIVIRGKTFEVVGLDHKKWKRPVIIKEVSTGKTFVFDADGLNRLLGGTPSLPPVNSLTLVDKPN